MSPEKIVDRPDAQYPCGFAGRYPEKTHVHCVVAAGVFVFDSDEEARFIPGACINAINKINCLYYLFVKYFYSLHVLLKESVMATAPEKKVTAAKPTVIPAKKIASAAAKAIPVAVTKVATKVATKAAPKVTPKVAAKPASKPAPKAAAKPSGAGKAAAGKTLKAAAKPAALARTRTSTPAVKVAAEKPALVAVKEKAKKAKLVRDSFTMPETEYAVLGHVKKTCIAAGIEVKKSQLLRIGLLLLSKADLPGLKALIADLEPLKAGRPKKDK